MHISPSEQVRRARLRLWGGVLFTLVLLNLGLGFLAWQHRQAMFMEARERTQEASMMVLVRAETTMQKMNYLLSGIGEVVAARGGMQDQPDLYLHRLLIRRNALADSVRWLFLVNSEGVLRESSSRFPSRPLSFKDREYFRQQQEHWDLGLFVGEPLVSRVAGESFIPVSRRLTNDGGLFLGVAVAGLNPEALIELLASQRLPEGYSGGVFLTSRVPLACHGIECSRDSLKTPALPQGRAGSDVDGGVLIGNDSVIGHYEVSGLFPLVIAVQVPEALIVSQWHSWMQSRLPLVLGANLVVSLMSLAAFAQLLRRREAVDALVAANEVLDARVQERTLQLQGSEARARAFMMATTDAVIVIDAGSRILEFNRGAEQMFHYPAQEVIGASLDLLMPPEMVLRHHDLVRRANSSVAGAMSKGLEVTAMRRDGTRFPVDVTIGTASLPEGMVFVGVMRDITERKQVEWRLTQLATTDALTGVFNRRAFMEQGESMFALARRYEWPLSIMMVDADHFKRVNDTYGHHVGDLVLQTLSARLQETLRSTDILGRLGGEEFGLVLPETGQEGARELAERILSAIRGAEVLLEDGTVIRFTVSIGVAVLNAGIQDLPELFQRADQALYQAKQGGRDRSQVFS